MGSPTVPRPNCWSAPIGVTRALRPGRCASGQRQGDADGVRAGRQWFANVYDRAGERGAAWFLMVGEKAHEKLVAKLAAKAVGYLEDGETVQDVLTGQSDAPPHSQLMG